MRKFKTTASAKVQEMMEKKIITGLQAEWYSKALRLPANYPNIQMPIFILLDMENYGYWDADNSSMLFSQKFVFNSSWNDIRDCLYHEMAHQLHSVVCPDCNSSVNDTTFREICLDIGTDPATSGEYIPASERIFKDEPLTDNDKIMVWVQKLMALATSSNRHEAEAACAKANQLIQKHNIELIEKNTPRDYVSMFIDEPRQRHSSDTTYLMSLLRDFYFVRPVWVSTWVVKNDKVGKVPEISGRKMNVQIAHYVYHYIKRYIDNEWAKFNINKIYHHTQKNSFAKGVIIGFHDKLQGQKTKTMEADGEAEALARGALVLREDRELNDYVEIRYGKLSNRKQKSEITPSTYNAGVKAGKNLTISKGLTHQGSTRGNLLTMGV